jgi:uncharacterized protein YbbC (DUF1343 family)
MVFFSTIPFEEDPDKVLQSGALGLLCNQAAWHGEYLFETLYKKRNLKRLFMPEHGLFGELQDQVKLDLTGTAAAIAGGTAAGAYAGLGMKGCEFVSLYGSDESTLKAGPEKFAGLDALVIELQDVGARYYTFLSTLRNIFLTLKENNLPLPVWILDRENPAGAGVEGSPLKEGYGSFIGIEGIPHRYGLTIGEMASLFYAESGAEFPLHIVSRNASSSRISPWVIAPSPNIPGFFTADFYPGQCLWEGTNVSEGRGTTRPFEVFGAPWMESLMAYNRKRGFANWNDPAHPLYDPGAFLRWQRFIPTFHKFKDECCFGFQLIRNPGRPYHALLHALRIIRFTAENCGEFAFRPGKYEAGSDKTAIELLAGDPLLLDYLRGYGTLQEIREYLGETERQWIGRVKDHRLYEEKLVSNSIF